MGKKGKSKTKNATKTTRTAPPNPVIDAANAVRDVMADFPSFAGFNRNGLAAKVTNAHAADLTIAQREAIVAMFEANMKQMYEDSDWGYDPVAKREELFDADARYLLATADTEAKELLGFVHFRFVEDDGANVLYVFEIQIGLQAQRKGLGKLLMQLLVLVARKHAIEFILLTVFKANTAAMAFYRQKLGFEIDENSPSACGDHSQMYEILCKPIPLPARR